jgi:hypothetical protein
MENLNFKYDGQMPGFKNLFTFYLLLKSSGNGKFLHKNIIGQILNQEYIEEKANLYLPGIDTKKLVFFLYTLDIRYTNLGLIDLFNYHIKEFGYPPEANWNVGLHPILRDRIIQELNVISVSNKWVQFFRDHTLNQLLF